MTVCMKKLQTVKRKWEAKAESRNMTKKVQNRVSHKHLFQTQFLNAKPELTCSELSRFWLNITVKAWFEFESRFRIGLVLIQSFVSIRSLALGCNYVFAIWFEFVQLSLCFGSGLYFSR
ncbi:unnamed protein product [Lathyrus oleraceus]